MELSDEKVLETILRTWDEDQRRKKASRVMGRAKGASAPELVYEAPPVKSRRRGCTCGVCAKCLEDARWERIFQSKFADPDYYTRRGVTHISPLSD